MDFAKDTSNDEPDWYCPELVWAGYKSQGIDIEPPKSELIGEPGVTPHDIIHGKELFTIAFK